MTYERSSTIVAGVVALCALGTAVVVGVIWGSPENGTIIMTTLLGFLAPTITSLLALLKGEENKKQTANLGERMEHDIPVIAERAASAAAKEAVDVVSMIREYRLTENAEHATMVSKLDALPSTIFERMSDSEKRRSDQ